MPVRLERRPVSPAPVPTLDAAQERVVAHRGGPLRVLGAAGTGRTTTLVEAVVARLAEGIAPAAILVLAADRRAARDLRARLAVRVDSRASTGSLPVVTTFHSLAYSLLGAELAQDPDATLPRLLSGAEEDVRVRELLLGGVADGEVAWPDDLRAALPTLGLANEVRAILTRLREAELSPDELQRLADVHGRDAWASVAAFARAEEAVAALENVIDYATLLSLAVDIASQPALPGGAARPQFVYVDDAQDVTPVQWRLLDALAPRGRTCVVVAGDPDSALFGFRGSDRAGLLEYAETHPGCATEVLTTLWRHGDAIHAAARKVIGDPTLPPLPAAVVGRMRDARPAPGTAGTVDVRTYDSWSDLGAHVGALLREAHLEDGAAWDSMAVIVRSSALVGPLRRGLDAAGVPVRVSGDDLPLHAEPAVAVLLTGLGTAIARDAMAPGDAIDLLTGPLGMVDPEDLRAWARHRRRAHRQAHPDRAVPASSVLLAEALTHARDSDRVDRQADAVHDDAGATSVDQALAHVGGLLGRVRARAEEGDSPADLLWMLWSASSPDPQVPAWPERLRASALSGQRGASHDLDAVSALFDAAERVSERYGGVVGIPNFLAHMADQRLPAESISDRAGSALPAVPLLTAHAARGREWDTVIVCGLQEGTWPSARTRASVLDVDGLDVILSGSADEMSPTAATRRAAVAEAVAEERRLLAVALTRARRRLHVAAVKSADDRGDQPSRFLDDVASATGAEPTHVPGRPARAGTLDGLVAELRSAAEDPAVGDDIRAAAVTLLARLARESDLVPGADPDRWWGMEDPTHGTGPVRPAGDPVALSGSALDGLQGCPRQWFLDREARAEVGRGHALAFGSLVHALAQAVVQGLAPPDPQVLESYADQVWAELSFEAPWQAVAERAALRAALQRFCAYHQASQRTVAAVEHPFTVDIPLADDVVRLRGVIDRVELTVDGDVVLVDLKTMRRPPSGPDVRDHVQLATYQAAVLYGALEDVVGPDARPAGAELVQLRVDADASGALPRVQEQPALASVEDHWLGDLLVDAVRRVRMEDFPAVPGDDCRTCPFRRSCPAMPEGAEVGG